MLFAILEAKKCIKDVPIGCVIKKDGKIIASAHNRRELDDDVTAHAEILAIKEAQKVLDTSRLKDCEMYVTLEPCPMCAWAISMSGIPTVYFGSYNQQYGALESSIKLPLNPNLRIYGGIMEADCNKILEEFFERIRNDNKNRA
ncbi:MAG: nucleoside deaminase [Cyanobacteria bacterium SIG28]|nr:nucleoside deaminase [Cyanobacteria bacterium SIG28]